MSANEQDLNTMTDTFRLPFPLVLHLMLEQAEDKGFANYVSWNSDGTCFKVHDTKGFIAHVAPLYFRQTRYKSFQRQLHLYGFSRISSGKNRGFRAHDLFLRGRRNLCVNMKPKKTKKPVQSANQAPATSVYGVMPAELASFEIIEPFPVASDSIEPTPLSGSIIEPTLISGGIFGQSTSVEVEDGEACLQSFIDRFCESPVQDQPTVGLVNDSAIERAFADLFPLHPSETAFADFKDEFAPRMMNPFARKVCPEQTSAEASSPDYSRLDGMLASFISRAA